MPRAGPRTIRKYSDAFKLSAVRLSQQPGLQVQAVASALAIHPFMLSKWRKEVRDGESDREDIEAAADAIDDDPSFNVDDRWDVNGEVLDSLLTHLRIELSHKGIRHWLAPGFDPAFGDFELGYGPVNSGYWFS